MGFQSVVIVVANAPYGCLDPGLGNAFGILNRDILAATVALVGQATTMDRSLIMDRLVEGVQNQAGKCRPTNPPAHDIAGVNIDHEGHFDELRPCRNVGEVRLPLHVRCRGMRLTVYLIKRTQGAALTLIVVFSPACTGSRPACPDRASAAPPCSGAMSKPSRCICRYNLRTP